MVFWGVQKMQLCDFFREFNALMTSERLRFRRVVRVATEEGAETEKREMRAAE